MIDINFQQWRASGLLIALLSAAALSACGGGGGGGGGGSDAPTAIPANLAITAPASADVAGALQFGSSASSLAGLKYSWDFGDGSTSTDGNPSHSYARGGDYTISLHVVNEAGTSADTQFSVSVSNKSLVQGLVCSGAGQSGWCWEQPTPSGADRYDTFFVDANTGWTVGAGGTILKTTDGGTTWQGQYTGVDGSIRSVRFADANNGWATGDYGALLRTTDGGATWTVSKLANNSLTQLQVFDAKTLLVRDIYGSGYPMVSTDGGVNWQTSTFVPTQISAAKVMWTLSNGILSKSTDLGTTQVQMLNAQQSSSSYYYSNYSFQRMDDQRLLVSRTSQGYVNGSYIYTADFWRSLDGGVTWDTPAMQGLPANLGSSNLSFAYAGPGLLIISVNGSMYRSDDAGSSWLPVGAPFNSAYYSASFTALSDQVLMSYQYGSGYVSTDGGKSWTAMAMAAAAASNSYYSSLTSTQSFGAQGFQLGFSDGSIYRSKDLGKTWTTILGPSTTVSANQLRAFWAFDARHALGINGNGQLVESQDGGRSWTAKQNGLSTGYASPRILFASAKVGWLYLGDGRLYRSSDGGQTWVTGLTSNFYADSFRFVDENTGFAVANGRLSQSKDGGVSWTDVGALPTSAIQVSFQSATHGLAFGSNGIAETNDGGLSWTPRYTGSSTYISAAVYTDAKTVWAVGLFGDLLQSTDGGSSWQNVSLPVSNNAALSTIQFLDAQHGWIGGQNGTVLSTVDGGKTWQRQATGTSRSVLSLQFVDSKTGWILGDNGALLATGTGGD